MKARKHSWLRRAAALLLSAMMAVSMAGMVFADPGDIVYVKDPALKVSVAGDAFGESGAPASFTVSVGTELGDIYVEDDEAGHQDEELVKVGIDNVMLEVLDDAGTAYDVQQVGVSFSFQVKGDNADAAGIWLRVTATDSEGGEWFSNKQLTRPAKPVHPDPDPAIVTAISAAITAKATTAYINLEELADKGVVYPADWQYITNTYFEGTWYPNYEFLNLSLQFYWPGSGTTFFIDADDLDYSFAKLVDFKETTGLVNYEGKTEAEMLNAIRALTGSTRNPYTFGFAMSDSYDKRGTDVPAMTISKVVPQQWLNVYGHKALELFIFANTVTCDVCGNEHEKGHVMTTTTLDAIMQTQRISFKTSDLYKTLVLSKAAAAEATEKPSTDKNPNTGASDMVPAAVVFAVIALTSAGVLIFKKQH